MKEERKFLHDISTPLTVLQLNLENALILLQESGAGGSDQSLDLLRKCLEQVKKSSVLVRERRELLQKEGAT